MRAGAVFLRYGGFSNVRDCFYNVKNTIKAKIFSLYS